MNPKNILTLIGALLGLQGIGLFLGAEAITTEAFALWSPDDTGLKIGTMLHQAMGALSLSIGIILFSARSLAPAAGAKVLTGAAIGLLITTGQAFFHMATTEVKPPLPLLIMMTILAVVAFVTANKAKGSGDAA
jgi:hypothetical protein